MTAESAADARPYSLALLSTVASRKLFISELFFPLNLKTQRVSTDKHDTPIAAASRVGELPRSV
jgi:hypothetical protein